MYRSYLQASHKKLRASPLLLDETLDKVTISSLA